MSADSSRERIDRTYSSAQFAQMHDLSDAGYALYDRIYRAAFKPYLPADRSARIVDIGCGTGQFLHFLRGEGYTNAMGVDSSPEQLDICREKALMPAEQADAIEHLLAHKGRYDLVVANHLLEHLSGERAVQLCSASLAALAAGGALIATTPNMSNILAGRMFHADLTHLTGFTEDSLRHCFAAGGFSEIEITDGGVPISFAGRIRAAIERLCHSLTYRACSLPPPNVCSCSLMAIGRKLR